MHTLANIAQYASYTLTVIIAILAVIAPLTKSEADNKALDALRWIEDKLVTLVLPSVKNPTPPTV